MTKPARLRVLSLAAKWSGGGPFAVNREVSVALAELGHRVTARVADPAPPHPLVDLQVLSDIPGIKDPSAHLLRADGLPRNVDMIIGHGRFSGGAASYLRDHFYPNAKVVHFVHVTTDEMDRLRGDPLQSNRHTETERALIARSDLVVGVGPLLADDAARLARMCDPAPRVTEILPGVIPGTPPRYSTYQRRVNLLMFGRTDDQLKGADIAAATVRELHQKGLPVRLTMLGVHTSGVVEQERALSDIAGLPVRVRPYTSDAGIIEAELRGADIVIHPAVHEDFGLSPLEAAGYGIPVLVGGHTGVGMFLDDPARIPSHLGRPSVVHVGSDREAAAVTWAGRVEAIMRDLPGARERALALRQYLAEHYTWQDSAKTLVAEVAYIPPRSAAAGLAVARQPWRPPGPAYRPGGLSPQPGPRPPRRNPSLGR